MALARLSMLKSGSFLNESADTFDNDYKSLLEAASNWVARYCGRWDEENNVNAFENNTYANERHTGDDTNKLFLNHLPINSVAEVRLWDGVDSFDVESSDYYEVINKTYIYYPKLGESSGATWANWKSTYANGIKVTYNAGYIVDGWSAKAITDEFGVPQDLEYAVASIAHVMRKLGAKSGGRRGVSSMTVGPDAMAIEKFVQGLPEDALLILKNYKLVNF